MPIAQQIEYEELFWEIFHYGWNSYLISCKS